MLDTLQLFKRNKLYNLGTNVLSLHSPLNDFEDIVQEKQEDNLLIKLKNHEIPALDCND